MDDELVSFAPEESSADREKVTRDARESAPWKVLIVDDDEQIHIITKFSLKNYSFREKNLQFVSAYSGTEARSCMQQHPDTALILLDVVMESNNSGLEFVGYVRSELKNQIVRIILRTGQPGYAPEEEIIQNYDIDDYRLKTDMTHHKMWTVVTVSLRSYANLRALEAAKKDLTELNNTLEEKVANRTKELVEVNDRLRENVQEKRALVRTLSHDLKNYLNIITGSLQMRKKYQSPKDDHKIEKLWGRIQKAADHQLHLIEHILELEAISTGKKSLDLKSVTLRDIFDQGFFSLKDALHKKGLRLSYHSHCGEVAVLADPAALGNSVFNNILSNAIKFSPESGRIKVEVHSDESGMIKMTIEDHGIGMPASLRENLFRSDVQTTRPGTHGEKGTGFGMPIVKQYMELFGGSISVESQEQKHSDVTGKHGTTFSLFFRPAAAAQAGNHEFMAS